MIPQPEKLKITLFIEAYPNGTVYLYATDGFCDSPILVGAACLPLLGELSKIIDVPAALEVTEPEAITA